MAWPILVANNQIHARSIRLNMEIHHTLVSGIASRCDSAFVRCVGQEWMEHARSDSWPQTLERFIVATHEVAGAQLPREHDALEEKLTTPPPS